MSASVEPLAVAVKPPAAPALRVDDRARARVVAARQPREGEAGRRGRRRRVDLDRRADGGGDVADVVGAGQREQVAVAAGDGLRGRAGDRRRCAVAAAAVARQRPGRHRQRRAGEAGAAVGEVGAAVDHQRRAAVQIAGAAAAGGRDAVGGERAAARSGRVDRRGEARARADDPTPFVAVTDALPRPRVVEAVGERVGAGGVRPAGARDRSVMYRS